MGAVMERMLTIKEVAQILKVKPLTVYNWVKAGKLRAYKLGRIYRVAEKDLEVFLSSSSTEMLKEAPHA
jgi:putative molybdopterin biosynthesis protein